MELASDIEEGLEVVEDRLSDMVDSLSDMDDDMEDLEDMEDLRFLKKSLMIAMDERDRISQE